MLKKIIITIIVLTVLGLGGLAALIYFHEEDPNAPKYVQSKKIPLVVPGDVAVKTPAPEPVKPPVKVAKAPEPTPAPAAAPAPAPKKPAPVSTSKPKAASSEGNWIVNVASFTENAPATALKKKLIKGGHFAYNTEFMKDGTQWYRVRVGFFSSKEVAQKSANRIKSNYSHTGWITKASDKEKQKYLK